MIHARTFILGFPLLVGALAWWSVRESRHSHARPADGIVVMLPQQAPVLNPFQPATEVEREIIELIHEPLLRVGQDGALQPALAELWRWSQEVTCWLADEATAKRAQERLQAQIGETNRWAEWRLSSAQVEGNRLLLTFDDTGSAGVQQALAVIADLPVRPVAIWRIESRAPLKPSWDKFMASASEASQVRRVWFEGAHACEIVVAGSSQRLLDELRRYLGSNDDAVIQPIAEAGVLSEPVLDLDIRPGRQWHDGTPVTAEDARATLGFLRAREWPLPNREALRHIQSMDVQNNGSRLHMTFRRRYGPALCLFADLPVLPAAWLRAHSDPKEEDFIQRAPPGAGSHRVALRDTRSLILTPSHADQGSPRFLFNFVASPLMTQTGMRTSTVDLVWPATAADHAHLTQLRYTPPRRRLVVLWNTQHEVLRHVRLREALAMGTDTDDLIRTLPGRLGHVDGSLFAPGLWYSTHAPRVPFDLENARHLLVDEGWPRDVNGVARSPAQALRFTLLVPSGDALHMRTAQRLVEQWGKLGAQVKIETAEDEQSLAQRLREHRFDAVLLDQRFEVSWDQMPWWHSSQAKPGGTNFCGISDPQIDLQLEALAGEFEPDQVLARVRELEARLLPLHPLLTLFTTHDEAAAMPSLPGAEPSGPSGPWTLRTIAVPPRREPAPPAIQLQLRLPE